MKDIHDINLNLLVVLECILRSGSVTAAAEQLHLSQSAVSHALRKLRVLFKDPLMIQQGHRLEPTSLALDLAPRIQKFVADAQELVFEPIRFDAKASEREFHLSALDYLDLLMLPPIYALMVEQSPHCSLQVHRPLGNDIHATLEQNPSYATVGVVARPLPEILEKILWPETFMSATSLHHPLAKNNQLSLDDYIRYDHALISTGDQEKSLVDDVLESMQKSRRKAVIVPSFLSIPLLVSQSDLIVTAPAHCLQMLGKHLPLKLYPTPLKLPGFTMKLFWHRRYDRDPAQQFFRRMIAASAEKIRQQSVGR